MIAPEKLEEFLRKVMAVERRYANELRNATTERRSAVRDVVEQFAAKHLEAGLQNEAK